MAKSDNSNKSGGSSFNIGEFFKGIFQKKEKTEEPGPEKTPAEETTEQQKKRPTAHESLAESRESRIFDKLGIVGPQSGALHNMEHILLRRGYQVSVSHIVQTKKRSFTKTTLEKAVPKDTECILLFEPETIEQTRQMLLELSKANNCPIVLITKKMTNPEWRKEVLKEMDMAGRTLPRFNYRELKQMFAAIVASPGVEEQKQKPQKPPTIKKTPLPKPELEEVEVPATQPSGPSLEEVSTEGEVSPEQQKRTVRRVVEEKTEVIADSTVRPMTILSAYANEPDVYYRIEGREDEGISPDQILTRREFETLFNSRFQEKWQLTLLQDPEASPQVQIEVKKIEEEPEKETTIVEKPQPAPAAKAKETVGPTEADQLDLTPQIQEVRKWWQQGRTAKIFNELEALRRSFPSVKEMDSMRFIQSFVPLAAGPILFAKGRLDRTIDATMEEMCYEDVARNGLQAPLRLLAMIDASAVPEKFKETFEITQQSLSQSLQGLIPQMEDVEEFHRVNDHIRGHLDELDRLAEETFVIERYNGPQIFEYFDKLQKITIALHEDIVLIDPNMLIFSRLDRVIVGSQTRSDWALGFTEDTAEWKDRLKKFLHFLADVRIETFRLRSDLNLMAKLVEQGLEQLIQEMREVPYTKTAPGQPLEEISEKTLKEPGTGDVWNIFRHRENYLVELNCEKYPDARAFAVFDEESLEYKWLGFYKPVSSQQTGEEKQQQQDS